MMKRTRNQFRARVQKCFKKANQEGVKGVVTNSSNFSEVLKTSTFVDKSQLISELLAVGFVSVTAAPGFGKSTNMSMVKLFLEVEVDDNGKPASDVSLTDNYKLFTAHNLGICRPQHEEFFKQHMGQHPVISLSYKSLGKVSDFRSLLSQFKKILQRAYLQHGYLLSVQNLWLKGLNKTTFRKFIGLKGSRKTTMSEIKQGFTFLAEALSKHFNRRVFVLIDDYDAYMESLAFKDQRDTHRIVDFVDLVSGNLLRQSDCVDGAMLTGMFCTPMPTNDLFECWFLRDSPFCEFYGLTQAEVDKILEDFFRNDEERELARNTIADCYGGYTVLERDIKLYNIRSILKFLENDRRVLNSNWGRSSYEASIKPLLNKTTILELIQRLLLGKHDSVNTLLLFSPDNIVRLNKLRLEDTERSVSVELFLVFLYNIGYLSPIGDKSKRARVFLPLYVPNREVAFKLANILREVYMDQYNFTGKNIEALQNIINSFRPTAATRSQFIELHIVLNNLFSEATDYAKTEENYRFLLFTFMACKFIFTYSEAYRSDAKGRLDLLVINEHKVAILISAKSENVQKQQVQRELALTTLEEMVSKSGERVSDFFKGKVTGRVCLGLCFDWRSRVSFAYSHFFKKGDDLNKHTIIA